MNSQDNPKIRRNPDYNEQTGEISNFSTVDPAVEKEKEIDNNLSSKPIQDYSISNPLSNNVSNLSTPSSNNAVLSSVSSGDLNPIGSFIQHLDTLISKEDLKSFQRDCTFALGVGKIQQLPTNGLIEVAFWGRSNVGKSSLVNALVNRKNLVRVSNTPGRTKELNFFNLDQKLYIVDLPGYGYAKVSKSQKALWNDLVISYFQTAKNLKRTYLLIDSKVGFKTIDLEIIDFLNYYGRSYQIVLTKADKIAKKNLLPLQEQVKELINKNPACFPFYIITSGRTKDGILELQKAILLLFKQNTNLL
ncbi:YihA family GTP-binding protein YsxC/EngB [Candidatus Hepatincolaceae symbiont of Richtersius coronifer]